MILAQKEKVPDRENDAFHLLRLLKVDDALRPVALGEFLSRFRLGLGRLDRR